MNRADRREWERFRKRVRAGKATVGRDQAFADDANPRRRDEQAALVSGSGSERRSKSKGGNKGGTWGPQADGG